jgi:protease-4
MSTLITEDFMKYLASLLLCLLLSSLSFAQTSISSYHERNNFLFTSSGSLKFGLYGYENPALLSYVRQPDMLLTWWDKTAPWTQLKRWGLFVGVPNVGFGTIHEKLPIGHYADYRISIASGDRTLSTGISYGWTIADHPSLDKSSILTSGVLYRPTPYISTGMTLTEAINTKGYEVAGDIAGRPWGNELVTLFAEYILHRTPEKRKDYWSFGAAIEALPGIRITSRYFDTKVVTLGVQLSLGRLGFETQSHFNENQKHVYNSYGVRMGAYDRNLVETVFEPKHGSVGIVKQGKKFVQIDQQTRIDYRRFMFFDNTMTLKDVLSMIDAAEKDPAVGGIAINTSAMEINRELAWEVRVKLKEFKASGKKVFILIDRGNIDTYHFASVADKIVMDPLGTIMLEGYSMGRTYLKGTLEKIGLGYDEWRFFKYKSAAESLARDKMSDADREQRQKLIDDWYKITRQEICESRHLTLEQLDDLVNNNVFFLASQAREKGLIDSIGRWETVKDLVKAETGDKKASFTSFESLTKFQLPYDNRWSEPPQIAIVYALGTCAMDEGITARKLVKDFETVADDSRVKAIVLRIDSPGGDAMATDYISEAMKKVKGKKPVIVSQGFVAASGGYWLSMYADTIVAAPGTITGSIGVIGGWMYNKGLKESLGMSTDLVKVGTHADLGFGMRLPLIGLQVPDRNLTPDERTVAETAIKTMYKDFVGKVSLGRKKTYDEVDAIGQGRVWSGLDGKQNGLVDVLGGLETAINIAKERANISKDQEVTIVEIPKKRLFDFNVFMPRLFGYESKISTDPIIDQLKFRLQHNGEPMPMLPLEDAIGINR